MAADSTRNFTSTLGDGGGDIAANALQTYYSKLLLKSLEKEIVLAKLGSKHPMPKGSGSKTMRMFRYPDGSASNVTALSEGSPPTHNVLQIEKVEVTLAQYGQVIAISDVLHMIELFNNVEQATIRAGKDAAYHFDSVIRAELLTNTAGVTNIYAGTSSYGANVKKITRTQILDGATALAINKTPKIGGAYVAVHGPQVCRDIRNDGDWIQIREYADPQSLINGEVGMMDGVRFVQTTEPARVANTGAQYTYNASGTTFVTPIFGADAFGVSSLEEQSPYAPNVAIVTGRDKSDPLDQKILVAFKSFFGTLLTQPKYMARVYSITEYDL